jgi:fatty acid desaturase
MNPVSRWIYWNMNYHVEHHMFPMVPYHALPKLHELIKHDLPEPNPSMWHAYKEVWPVLLRQLKYEDYYLKRELPPTARPYRDEFHNFVIPTAAE